MRGILIVAIAVLASPALAEFPRKAPHPQDGRFVMYFGPFARADVFLLDSHTGRVWQFVTSKDGALSFEEKPITVLPTANKPPPKLLDSGAVVRAYKKICGRAPRDREIGYLVGVSMVEPMTENDVEAMLADKTASACTSKLDP